MSISSQQLIASFCRTCVQQLPCESSYNLFATPALAKKLSVCTSLSVELQDGFPENICGVCYTRLNEMHDFQVQCVNAVQKFQDVVRLIDLNEIKVPLGFGKSHNEQQATNGIKNEIIISNDSEAININSENSMEKIRECEKVVLGGIDKIEIEDTQMIEENFNTKRGNLQYHKKTLNAGKSYKCEICGKQFTRSENLRYHKNTHSGEKPHGCKICGKKFSHPVYLKVHEAIHSRETLQKCEICDKTFTTTLNLTNPKNIHTGEKPYVCKTCGKEYSHRNCLRSHEMIHIEKKNHKCEICDKTFTRATTLKRHKMIHIVGKPYVCKICGKNFSLPVQLKLHEENHSKKPYTCKTCGKSYKRHLSLRLHEGTHTGNSFACKTCGKDFPRREYLNLHERRRHSMKKPFKCEICLKGFVQSTELRRHKRTHTEESSFVCETCGKGFKGKLLLQLHQKECIHVTCNESEVSDKSNFKTEIEHDSPVSSDMDEQEFIGISSK